MLAEHCNNLLSSSDSEVAAQEFAETLLRMENLKPNISVVFAPRLRSVFLDCMPPGDDRLSIQRANEYVQLTLARFLYRDTCGGTIPKDLG